MNLPPIVNKTKETKNKPKTTLSDKLPKITKNKISIETASKASSSESRVKKEPISNKNFIKKNHSRSISRTSSKASLIKKDHTNESRSSSKSSTQTVRLTKSEIAK